MTLDALYGFGRLCFGLGLLAAPTAVGRVLIGADAGMPAVRMLFRFYGTRDTLLGVGTLRAAARGKDVDGWLTVGIGADVLDAAVISAEWGKIPPGKRVPGLLAATGAGLAGAAVLARR